MRTSMGEFGPIADQGGDAPSNALLDFLEIVLQLYGSAGSSGRAEFKRRSVTCRPRTTYCRMVSSRALPERDSFQEEIQAMLRFGSVSYANWAGYAWKNELNEQRDRVLQHLGEIIDDAETEHNPHHMLERAFSLAAFCMRRLLECRLVTDRFRDNDLSISEIYRNSGERPKNRDPFFCHTGGNFFDNFEMKNRVEVKKKPKLIADKFLHIRFIAVLKKVCISQMVLSWPLIIRRSILCFI